MIKADSQNKSAKTPSDPSKFITVFTDGSFCAKTKAWGVGVWIRSGENKTVTFSKGGVGLKCCNEVELFGLQLAKKYIEKNIDTNDKVVVFQSDSLVALDKFNKSIQGSRYVKLKHVKGHNSNGTKRSYVNNLVDRLAKKEMRKHRGVLK